MSRVRIRSSSFRRRGGGSGCFLAGIPFVVIGALVLVLGWNQYKETRAEIAASSTATGVVVDYHEREGSEGETLFALVVEFTAADGEEVRFTDALAASNPSQRIGEAVEVYYDPAFPRTARVKSFWGAWGFPVFLMAFGGLFALAGMLAFFGGLIKVVRLVAALGLAGVGGLTGLALLLLGRRKAPAERTSQDGQG